MQALFDKPTEVAEIRDKIDAVREALPDATVQDVRIAKEEPGMRFVINTSNPDIDNVEATLGEIFKGELRANHVELARLDPIPVGEPAAEPKPTTDGEAAAPAADTEPSISAPGDDKPAAENPEADKPAAAPGDGASGKKVRATDDSMLLALADAPATAAQEETAQEPKSSDAKAAEAETDQPAEAPPTEKPADASATNEPAAAAPPDKASEPATTTQPSDTIGSATPSSTRFAGGTKAVLKFSDAIGHDRVAKLIEESEDKAGIDKLTATFDLRAKGYEPGSDASFDEWEVRTSLPPDTARRLFEQAAKTLADEPFFPASNKIGAAVAAATQQQAAVAMIASLALILAYIWFRFSQVMFGVAGVVAVVHDVLVTLGALALSTWIARIPGLDFLLVEPFKISLPIIAAFLTIIGYSLNDTIVIFDRIREMRGKSPVISVELANSAINQTLSRTILTSLTVFIVVLILYIVGGEGIHAFAFALVVGVIAGSYSTIYIATPIVLWMNRSVEGSPSAVRSGSVEGSVAQRA